MYCNMKKLILVLTYVIQNSWQDGITKEPTGRAANIIQDTSDPCITIIQYESIHNPGTLNITVGQWQYCPYNQFAVGYKTKDAPYKGGYLPPDDAGITGLALYCGFNSSDISETNNITSIFGDEGSWSSSIIDAGGFISGLNVMVDMDETASVNPNGQTTDNWGIYGISYSIENEQGVKRTKNSLIYGRTQFSGIGNLQCAMQEYICALRTTAAYKNFGSRLIDDRGITDVAIGCCKMRTADDPCNPVTTPKPTTKPPATTAPPTTKPPATTAPPTTKPPATTALPTTKPPVTPAAPKPPPISPSTSGNGSWCNATDCRIEMNCKTYMVCQRVDLTGNPDNVDGILIYKTCPKDHFTMAVNVSNSDPRDILVVACVEWGKLTAERKQQVLEDDVCSYCDVIPVADCSPQFMFRNATGDMGPAQTCPDNTIIDSTQRSCVKPCESTGELLEKCKANGKCVS